MSDRDRPLLRLRAVGDERAASTRYRVLAHRPALEAAGYDTELHLAPRLGRPARALSGLADLLRPRRAELLFVHRKTYPPWVAWHLARTAERLVFDMDDAIDLPPPSRPLGPEARARYRRRFEETVRAFDLVLCGSPELLARLPHGRAEILPTPVDTARFSPARSGAAGLPTTLGWVGHSDNLPYLEALSAPLSELLRRHPALKLVVVSDRRPHIPGLPLEFRPWRLEREVEDFEGIGLGLMPLADTPWARGKCAYKALQYLALGIPTVASPVGMTAEVVRHGKTGFLAASDREWVLALDTLITRRDLAREIGEAGRRLVERSYALDVVSRRLVELLAEVRARPSSNAAHSAD